MTAMNSIPLDAKTFVVAASAFLLAGLAFRLMLRRAKAAASNRLFEKLCKAHGLSRSDCRLLRELARHQKLDDPAQLFLEPERFAAACLPMNLWGRTARMNEIRDRLFQLPPQPAKRPHHLGEIPAQRQGAKKTTQRT